MDPNAENAFPQGIFWPNSVYIKTTPIININERKKLKNNAWLYRGKTAETIIFMSRHFDKTMTILILHFLRFGALKISTGDFFVLKINQIIYSK